MQIPPHFHFVIVVRVIEVLLFMTVTIKRQVEKHTYERVQMCVFAVDCCIIIDISCYPRKHYPRVQAERCSTWTAINCLRTLANLIDHLVKTVTKNVSLSVSCKANGEEDLKEKETVRCCLVCLVTGMVVLCTDDEAIY